jgi:hypothetical protein
MRELQARARERAKRIRGALDSIHGVMLCCLGFVWTGKCRLRCEFADRLRLGELSFWRPSSLSAGLIGRRTTGRFMPDVTTSARSALAEDRPVLRPRLGFSSAEFLVARWPAVILSVLLPLLLLLDFLVRLPVLDTEVGEEFVAFEPGPFAEED